MPLDNLPDPIKKHIIKTVQGEEYTSKPNTYSLTTLLYCIRKAYYKKTYGTQKLSIQSSYNIYRGQIFDKLWTPLFTNNQIRTTHKCRNIPITISGKYDFLMTDPDGSSVICDLKTTKNLYYINEPSKEYSDQVRFYAWENSIEKARLIYVDFGDCKIFDIPVGDCTQLINELEYKATQLYFAFKQEKTPQKPLNTEKWQCNLCDYKEQCQTEP